MTAPIPRRRRPRFSFLERKWLLTGRPGAIPYLQNGKWAQSLWREFGEIITERHIARYGLFHRRTIGGGSTPPIPAAPAKAPTTTSCGIPNY